MACADSSGIGGERDTGPISPTERETGERVAGTMTPQGALYRVWKAARRSREASRRPRDFYSVSSLQEAELAISLLKRREREPCFSADCDYGLEVLTDTGWTEWCDSDGRDVMTLLRA